ncbi:hypothetical protein [Ornithinibacillus scapharcae]|uniref:hypothetical protein n=1 Tax=Ornithinibacillus scapharcae TaxID=1147159 RepID=UPI000225B2DB|nr:hypothetical protein [Ornithinibacillus scapharcae]
MKAHVELNKLREKMKQGIGFNEDDLTIARDVASQLNSPEAIGMYATVKRGRNLLDTEEMKDN